MGRPRFLTMRFEICRMTDLTPADKLVLARIAGFDDYFESAEKCAELLGYTPGTVRKIKQKLEKKGYIIATSNNGRGKRYVAREDFRVKKRKKAEAETPVQPNVDTSMLRPSKTQPKTNRDWDKWKVKNKDLVPALDACMNYLAWRQIPVVDPKALRRSLTITADMFRNPDDPDAPVRVIKGYIRYLQSDEYAYQAQHTKFCPIITTQDDLFRNFNAVREFKWDESRHYDPRKVLTRD